MSKKPDITEVAMSFEEKTTWVSAVVMAVVSAAYFAIILSSLGSVPVTEIAYQKSMLIAVGVTIVLTIVGSILTGIGTGISLEITGNGSVDEIGRTDERDHDISRRGDLVGYYVSSVGAVGVLALAMLEYPQFWIANALYLSFAVGTLVAAVVKLVAYRRGF
jgi:hypothetical protein